MVVLVEDVNPYTMEGIQFCTFPLLFLSGSSQFFLFFQRDDGINVFLSCDFNLDEVGSKGRITEERQGSYRIVVNKSIIQIL
jgi:hypothetical protein